MQGGAGLALLGETIAATTARAAGTEWAGFAADLDAAVARLGAVTATLWGAGDPDVALANAHVYLEAAGHVVVAGCGWSRRWRPAGATSDFYDGKRQAARYFLRWELPRVAPPVRPAGVAGPHGAGRAARLVLSEAPLAPES